VRALHLDRLHLLRLDLNVLAFGDLVTAALVVLVDGLAGLLVDHLLAQAVAGAAVDLVEVRLLGLTGGRKKRDRTGDERQLEIALPVGAAGSGHDDLRTGFFA
jgi:hypothetical protein